VRRGPCIFLDNWPTQRTVLEMSTDRIRRSHWEAVRDLTKSVDRWMGFRRDFVYIFTDPMSPRVICPGDDIVETLSDIADPNLSLLGFDLPGLDGVRWAIGVVLVGDRGGSSSVTGRPILGLRMRSAFTAQPDGRIVGFSWLEDATRGLLNDTGLGQPELSGLLRSAAIRLAVGSGVR